MKEKIERLMLEKSMSFNALHSHFKMSKQTLTQKLNGTLDWTFPEIMVLCQLFDIENPQEFFSSSK